MPDAAVNTGLQRRHGIRDLNAPCSPISQHDVLTAQINLIPKLTVVLQDGCVDSWRPIDDLIVQRRIIPAMQAIREAEECSLQRAIDIFAERYELLRRTRPDDFGVPSDEYWRGVYT